MKTRSKNIQTDFTALKNVKSLHFDTEGMILDKYSEKVYAIQDLLFNSSLILALRSWKLIYISFKDISQENNMFVAGLLDELVSVKPRILTCEFFGLEVGLTSFESLLNLLSVLEPDCLASLSIEQAMDESLLPSLITVLKRHENISSLYLLGIAWTEEDSFFMQEFVEFLEISRLKDLTIFNCGLETEDALDIIDALKVQNTITSLNMSENFLGDEIFEPLSLLLENPDSKLTSLSIFNNYFDQNGIRHLIRPLEYNYNLKTIRISITTEALSRENAISLGQIIRKNKSLVLFDAAIFDNDPNQRNLKILAEAVNHNDTLEHFNMPINCEVTRDFLDSITDKFVFFDTCNSNRNVSHCPFHMNQRAWQLITVSRLVTLLALPNELKEHVIRMAIPSFYSSENADLILKVLQDRRFFGQLSENAQFKSFNWQNLVRVCHFLLSHKG